MIQIDKGIPIPDKIAKRNRKYPFDYMEVGDSFLTGLKVVSEIASSKTLAEKRTGFKFEPFVIDGFVRVWRVK